jgi:hypothetical protein
MNARIQTRDDYNNMTSGEIIEKQENRKKNDKRLIPAQHPGSSPKLKSLQNLRIRIKA